MVYLFAFIDQNMISQIGEIVYQYRNKGNVNEVERKYVNGLHWELVNIHEKTT